MQGLFRYEPNLDFVVHNWSQTPGRWSGPWTCRTPMALVPVH